MEDRNSIQERMLENIDDKFDKSVGSFFYDALKPVAIELEGKGKELDDVKDRFDVSKLKGNELTMYVYSRSGLKRKEATKATTLVTIKGSVGAEVSAGDLVASDTLNYVVLEGKTISKSGEVKVLVECEESGSIGNAPVGAIKYFPVSIQGLTNVTNEETITNGYDEESDEDLLARYYEKIRAPATSGNKHHYLLWAKEVTGVGDARVFPLWNGNNTVKVMVIDSNKQPASEDLIEEVQNYIDPGITGLGEGQAPIGAFCTVQSAIGKDIDISFTVNKDDRHDVEQVKTNVSNDITQYLQSLAFKEDTISYAKIGATILDSEGVLDYSDLKINLASANISIGDDEVPILRTVTANE